MPHDHPVDDEQLARLAGLHGGQPFTEFGRGLRVDAGGAGQDRGAVGLRGVDPGDVGIVATGQRRRDRFAFDHHRLEVGADAPGLEPAPAPHREGERIELAEVGRPLDRGAGQPELVGDITVVHAGVTVVRLIRQHLPRMALPAR